MIAQGDPKLLLAESRDPKVLEFLTRGEEKEGPSDESNAGLMGNVTERSNLNL
jgi:hypothetical protein